jgi:hypothetical protein
MDGFSNAPQYSVNGKDQVTLAYKETCIYMVLNILIFIFYGYTLYQIKKLVAYYIITRIKCTSNIVHKFNNRMVSGAMAQKRVTSFSAGNRASKFCGRLCRANGVHMLQQMAAHLEEPLCVTLHQCSLCGVRTTLGRL